MKGHSMRMNEPKGKELWLFTMRFPYGSGETFIGTELPFLCKRFERVVVMPLVVEGEPREMPANAVVRQVLPEPFKPAGPVTILRYWKIWQDLVKSVRASSPSPSVLRKQWPAVRSQSRHALERFQFLSTTLFPKFDPERVVLYSFWTADWATVLGLWKASDPRVRFFGRMQGFDLYAERNPDNWPPFRQFQLGHIERIFVTSRTGLDYLEGQYPEHIGTFEYSPLGTVDHGLAPWEPSPVTRIVSVANLIPIKRVHLLAEALRLLDIPVEWTHFGDGPERDRSEKIIAMLPPNVRVNLMGRIPHAEVLEWYKSHPVDLFVHTSSTEGLPLSMKEAASFGIPMLAVNAGGVKEIVNANTGVLLPSEADAAMIAAQIRDHRTSPRNTVVFRTGARAWWAKNFKADEAYGRFIDRFLIVHAGDRRQVDQ